MVLKILASFVQVFCECVFLFFRQSVQYFCCGAILADFPFFNLFCCCLNDFLWKLRLPRSRSRISQLSMSFARSELLLCRILVHEQGRRIQKRRSIASEGGPACFYILVQNVFSIFPFQKNFLFSQSFPIFFAAALSCSVYVFVCRLSQCFACLQLVLQDVVFSRIA